MSQKIFKEITSKREKGIFRDRYSYDFRHIGSKMADHKGE